VKRKSPRNSSLRGLDRNRGVVQWPGAGVPLGVVPVPTLNVLPDAGVVPVPDGGVLPPAVNVLPDGGVDGVPPDVLVPPGVKVDPLPAFWPEPCPP
jgi:hypothetical protein